MHPSLVDTHTQIIPADTGRFPATLLEAMSFYGDPDVARGPGRRPLGDAPECLHAIPGIAIFIFRPAHLEVPFLPQAVLAQGRTIFEDSPIGLDRWLIAIWMVANSEQRVSTYRLHRLLEHPTTTTFMLRRIRLAIQARSSASERSAAIAGAERMTKPKEQPEERNPEARQIIRLLTEIAAGPKPPFRTRS